ncbi:hypothetical protein HOJ01_01585 [bacterium]|jgi:hypothetical protein|nr:hypothetical protein [bacterium]MBT6293479.1 hypothetical protein [bacterium]
MKKIKPKFKAKSKKSDLFGDLNQSLVASSLESSVVNLEGFYNVFDSADDLTEVLNDCAKTSLKHIDVSTLQYDISTLPKLMAIIFGKYPFAYQRIVNDFLFPLTTQIIINYLNNNIQDSQDFMLMKNQIMQLPDSLRDIILERSAKPLLISHVDQEIFLNKLEIALGLLKSELTFEDFEISLMQVNKFTNLFCGTSVESVSIH